MKRLYLTGFLFCTSLLMGCTINHNYKVSNPKTGNTYFAKDNYECELIARKNTIPERYGYAFDDIRYGDEKRQMFLNCMASRGYIYEEQ